MTDHTPCPECGEPLHDATLEYCFRCGWEIEHGETRHPRDIPRVILEFCPDCTGDRAHQTIWKCPPEEPEIPEWDPPPEWTPPDPKTLDATGNDLTALRFGIAQERARRRAVKSRQTVRHSARSFGDRHGVPVPEGAAARGETTPQARWFTADTFGGFGRALYTLTGAAWKLGKLTDHTPTGPDVMRLAKVLDPERAARLTKHAMKCGVSRRRFGSFAGLVSAVKRGRVAANMRRLVRLRLLCLGWTLQKAAAGLSRRTAFRHAQGLSRDKTGKVRASATNDRYSTGNGPSGITRLRKARPKSTLSPIWLPQPAPPPRYTLPVTVYDYPCP